MNFEFICNLKKSFLFKGSELEDVEIEIYKKRCLNMKISDFIDLKTVKDQFSNKMMLGDAHTAERLLELHPEIKDDRTFVSAMVYQAASSRSSSCLRTLFHRGTTLCFNIHSVH